MKAWTMNDKYNIKLIKTTLIHTLILVNLINVNASEKYLKSDKYVINNHNRTLITNDVRLKIENCTNISNKNISINSIKFLKSDVFNKNNTQSTDEQIDEDASRKDNDSICNSIKKIAEYSKSNLTKRSLIGENGIDYNSEFGKIDTVDKLISLYQNGMLTDDSNEKNSDENDRISYKDMNKLENLESDIDIDFDSEVMKRSINETYFNKTDDIDYIINITDCKGAIEYCNMTKDEYLDMIYEYIYPQPYEWVLIAIHAIVFIIGLIGNALVCIAVYRNHTMRTVTNYFIVNLAVADFMVILFCLPPTVLWDVTESWLFGNTLCRVILYFQSVSVMVSVLTLTFISLDRWYAICFPLRFKSTTSNAKKAIFIIWLISLLFNIPEFVVLEAKPSQELRFDLKFFIQCTSTWSPESDLKWRIALSLVLYTIPLILMTVAYFQIVKVLWRSDHYPGDSDKNSHQNNMLASGVSGSVSMPKRSAMSIHTNISCEGQIRSRRKAAKMLVAVVIMFAVCYFPVHLISVLRLAMGIKQTDAITFLALLSHVMCYANSAVNPLIYNFMSGKFRREFHRSFFNCRCWNKSQTDRLGASFTAIGSSRAGTTRTLIKRNDSCVSYRLTHLSPNNYNTASLNRDDRGKTTAFMSSDMTNNDKD